MDAATLAALATFPDQLEAHFAAMPATHRAWTPADWDGIPSERFSAIEHLCHVRDIECEGYQVRFARTLHEDGPFLAAIDGEAWARERRYAQADADAALQAFRAARTRTLALLAGLDAAQRARTAVFEGYGPVTFDSLVHYLCSHDQQHLAGLQWLRGRIAAA